MSVKLLTEHHLEVLSLKGGSTGTSESTLVKMPHCWKSHVTAHISFLFSDMIWNDTFVPGQKYFITVEACNGANLCKKRSSNGIILDNSPPVNGLVRVGSHGDHQTYQPHK